MKSFLFLERFVEAEKTGRECYHVLFVCSLSLKRGMSLLLAVAELFERNTLLYGSSIDFFCRERFPALRSIGHCSKYKLVFFPQKSMCFGLF